MTAQVIKPIDVFEDGDLSLSVGVPGVSPDQFSFDGLKERFHSGVVV